MKVAYVTTYDASDIKNWSGSGYYIAKALEQQSIEICRIGPLQDYSSWWIRAKPHLYSRLFKQFHHSDREPKVLQHYADQVAAQLKQVNADIVFSPGTHAIAYLECHQPIVFWTDATFAGMIDFYPDWSNLCRETIVNGNRMEQTALTNSRLAIYSSDWAANTAIKHYSVNSEMVKVVPFGANIECDRSIKDIQAIVANRAESVCKLLFLGIDWYRKGGDFALELADMLVGMGIRVELTIVGCVPPHPVPDYVKVKGFISKNSVEGRRCIDQLLADSHFLVLPSRAECFGVAIVEASSFGLPAVGTNVGGMPTALRAERNGKAFSLSNFVAQASHYIFDLFNDRRAYRDLALSSFLEYERRLNWRVAGQTVKSLLEYV